LIVRRRAEAWALDQGVERGGLNLVPQDRNAKVVEASIRWDYTTVLNIMFLLLAAALVWRYFARGGGLKMLRMMNKPMVRDTNLERAGRARQVGDGCVSGFPDARSYGRGRL
jgi:hypothetical protein